MDTEPYPVVAGLLIRKAVTWLIPYLEYQMAMNTEGSHVADSVRIQSAIVAICYDYFMK